MTESNINSNNHGTSVVVGGVTHTSPGLKKIGGGYAGERVVSTAASQHNTFTPSGEPLSELQKAGAVHYDVGVTKMQISGSPEFAADVHITHPQTGSPVSGDQIRPDSVVQIGTMKTDLKTAQAMGLVDVVAGTVVLGSGGEAIVERQQAQGKGSVEQAVSLYSEPAQNSVKYLNAKTGGKFIGMLNQVLDAHCKGQDIPFEIQRALCDATGEPESRVRETLEGLSTQCLDAGCQYCAKMSGDLTPNQVFQLVDSASSSSKSSFLRACAANLPKEAYQVLQAIRRKDIR